MKALIIIACVIVYLIMWVVTGVIATRLNGEVEIGEFIGFFWPISLPIIAVGHLIELTDDWLTKQEERK